MSNLVKHVFSHRSVSLGGQLNMDYWLEFTRGDEAAVGLTQLTIIPLPKEFRQHNDVRRKPLLRDGLPMAANGRIVAIFEGKCKELI
jgi:hypothetical protein